MLTEEIKCIDGRYVCITLLRRDRVLQVHSEVLEEVHSDDVRSSSVHLR